jgi:hypothetical protein
VILLIATLSQIHASIAVLVFGLILGVFGHIIKSRTLIITGILIIGIFSAYFAFGVSHVS